MARGVVSSFIDVVFRPGSFYSTMSRRGGFGEPISFFLIFSSIGLLINIIGTSLMFGNPSLSYVPVLFVALEAGLFVGSFVAALLLHIVWKALGSRESYETSYRVFAYSAAISPFTSIIAFIPDVGIAIAMVWVFILLIIASSRVHNVKQSVAFAVWGIVGALMIVLTLSYELGYKKTFSMMAKNTHQTMSDSARQ